MKYLFIGGPIDGQRQSCSGRDTIYHPLFQKIDYRVSNIENLQFETHCYYLERLRIGTTYVNFYRSSEITLLDAMLMLFEKYPKCQEDED